MIDSLRDFGRHSHITWTAEDLRKEREAEMEKEYICLTESCTLDEDEIRICSNCGKKTCFVCGGEVSTIKEYDEAMKAND